MNYFLAFAILKNLSDCFGIVGSYLVIGSEQGFSKDQTLLAGGGSLGLFKKYSCCHLRAACHGASPGSGTKAGRIERSSWTLGSLTLGSERYGCCFLTSCRIVQIAR